MWSAEGGGFVKTTSYAFFNHKLDVKKDENHWSTVRSDHAPLLTVKPCNTDIF